MANSSEVLSDRVLEWVLGTVIPPAEVESIRRLSGSTSSTLHRIEVRTNSGVLNLVVRQFDNAAWLKEEPDLALHEAQSLLRASRAAVPTPKVVAFDETGDACGLPTVLMTFLDGHVDLQPAGVTGWLSGLAETLVRIHEVSPVGYPWNYFPYTDILTVEVPQWSSVPKKWEAAIEVVKDAPPQAKPSFIHRDYHPCNVLWRDGAVIGVVDWVNACSGPAGIDVGHCRLNLALLYGIEMADAFLDRYVEFAGSSFAYDPYWDLRSVFEIFPGPPTVYSGWTAFGVSGLTDDLMIQRIDDYTVSLLERL